MFYKKIFRAHKWKVPSVLLLQIASIKFFFYCWRSRDETLFKTKPEWIFSFRFLRIRIKV